MLELVVSLDDEGRLLFLLLFFLLIVVGFVLIILPILLDPILGEPEL